VHDIYFFVARNCQKVSEQNLDPGERIETKLVTFEEFLKLPEDPKFITSPQFVNYLLQLKFDEEKMKKFRKLLFPE